MLPLPRSVSRTTNRHRKAASKASAFLSVGGGLDRQPIDRPTNRSRARFGAKTRETTTIIIYTVSVQLMASVATITIPITDQAFENPKSINRDGWIPPQRSTDPVFRVRLRKQTGERDIRAPPER